MPNKDGTGPEGKGSKTGRGLGTCAGETKNTDNRLLNRGIGRRSGRDQGRGRNA